MKLKYILKRLAKIARKLNEDETMVDLWIELNDCISDLETIQKEIKERL